MTSTYTANNGIEKIETGDQSGTWGETTNTNFDIIDRALNGVGSITLSGTSHTLTTTDGSLTDGMFKVLSLAGSPTGTNTITISPNDQDKLYFVTNASGQSAVFSQGTGANVTIPNGGADIIFADGAGSGAAVSSLFASTVTFGSDVLVGDDLTLNSDSAVLGFGADTDTTLTHTDGTGLTLNSTNKLTFGDVASFIQQSSDGVLRVDGEATIDLNASTAVTVSNDLKLDSDSAVLGFGADNDTTLTHTDGSGLTLNSTNKLMFGDSGTFIHQSADGVLDLVSDTEIEINATTIDINGAVDVSGNITGGGNLDVSSGTIKLDGNYPTGTENVALGDTALDSVQAGGNNNVAIGNSAGTAITTGDSNNCIGHTAGPAINTGSQNVALGNGAGNSETTGSDNVLVGHAAGFTQNGKSQNTFVGSQAGYTVNASGNTFVGN